jgi:hypothetical protein
MPEWLQGWNYRKSHVINPASGAGTNYPIRITVHYNSGTDSGEHVYLNGKCRPDFLDIRFTRSDGITLLDFWLERKVDCYYAVFWVEIADDLSSNPVTIYIYYGNSSATRADLPHNIDLWQVREHQRDPSFYPNFLFSKSAASVLRIDSYTSGSASLGEGYAFLIVPKSYLHGKKVQIYWRAYYSYSSAATVGVVYVLDTELYRGASLPTQGITAIFQYITLLSIASSNGWSSWTTGTSGVINLSTFTSEYVTLLIYLGDAWTAQTTMLDVDWLKILDADGNILLTFDFTESVVMEQTETYEDYGLYRKYVSPEPIHGDWGSIEASYPVITESPVMINGESVKLNGYNGINVTIRGFEWGKQSGNYTDSWTESGAFPPGDFSHIITDLEPDTTYYFRAKVYSPQTGWLYGEELSFQTPMWLPGWSYRKQHNMYYFPTGAPFKYPMRFKVHYGSGVDNGEDVYLDGKCRSDFLDVRFTKKDGKTLLNYWLEKIENDYALFWVEVETAHPKVETGNWSIDGNTYRYRTKITVTERSGTNLSNYPVRVELDGKYLVEMGYATENGNEIRFADSNGVLLDFCRKSIFNSENATFWVNIPSLNANQTITIYMYYDADLTSVSKADKPQNIDIWHWREHQTDPSYRPDIRFSKPTATVLRIDSYTAGISSLGQGFIFIVVPKSYLHGKKVQIYWNGYFSASVSRVIGWVYVLDGVLDRSSKLATTGVTVQFPSIQLLTYATTSGKTGWMGWRLNTSSIINLSSFSSEYVTLIIGLSDGWDTSTVMLDIDYLNILDANNNVLITYHFTGSLLTDSSGGYEDGGIYRPYISPEPSCTVEVESELDANNNTHIYVYYGKSDASREDNPQDVDIFQLREHQTSTDYIPGFRFSGGAIKIDSSEELGASSVGEGFAFIIVPKNILHGRRLQVSWNLYSGATGITPLHVAVLDAEIHRMQTLPIQSIFSTFTYIDAIVYPPASATGKWLGDKLQSSDILNLSSFTNDYVTLVAYMGDSWSNAIVISIINDLYILDENYNVVKAYYLNDTVIMERTGTYEDYGIYRRYISPEPTHETWGEEETPYVPPPPTGFTIDGKNINISSLLHGSTPVFTESDEMVESLFKHRIVQFGAFKPFTIEGFEDISIPWSESTIKYLENMMRSGKPVKLEISHASFEYNGYVWILDLDFQTREKIRIFRITLQEAQT